MAGYCNVPVGREGISARIQLFYRGQLLDEQRLVLTDHPDMWAVFSLPEGNPEDFSIGFTECEPELLPKLTAMVQFSDTPADEQTAYTESIRPLAHFAPRRGFHNDPNGLLYYNGLYHMFYQLNPYGLNHANTHWGWAVSPDLLHWTERQPPLCPSDEDGNIFSGSGVVDRNNTSGLQTGEHPPIFLFYTATRVRFLPRIGFDEDGKPIFPEGWKRPEAVQCAAVSLDGGNSFQKWGRVVDSIVGLNRDPKVRWVEDAGCWVMALYLEENDYMLLYSDDLLHWEKGERITMPDTAECPDLFELFVDGDPDNAKWVLFGSPENYLLGHFEGRRFVAETPLIKGASQVGDTVKIFTNAATYAPQTFFGLPRGEEIQISWIPTVFPGAPFASCMSFPWKLSLVTTPNGIRLKADPIDAVKSLRTESVGLTEKKLARFGGKALDLEITLHFDHLNGRAMFSLRGVPVLVQNGGRELVFPTGIYRLPEPVNGEVSMRILADQGSVELFCGIFHCGLNSPLDSGKMGLEMLCLEGCKADGTLWKLRSVYDKDAE